MVPDANDIYGLPTAISAPATTEYGNLSPSEFSKAESRYEYANFMLILFSLMFQIYRFVKKMSIWKAHKKAAKRNKQHIKSLVVTEDGSAIEPKISSMPPNEHLLGKSYTLLLQSDHIYIRYEHFQVYLSRCP